MKLILRESAQNRPGVCAICHTAPEGQVLDCGDNLEQEKSTLYVCMNCIDEVCAAKGNPRPHDLVKRDAQIASLTEELDRLNLHIQELEEELETDYSLAAERILGRLEKASAKESE